MELRDILKEKSPDYYERIINIEKEAEFILPEIRIVFTKYTNHDIAHKKGIEHILNKMIPGPIKENLKSAEIFYLLVATFFHDVGMKLISEDEEREFNSLDEAGRDNFRDNIRNDHHIRSSNYIKDNASILNLSIEEAAVIADISRAHRKINIKEELTDPIHGDERIRSRFLGGLLRLADECHVTKDRVSELFLKTIKSTSYEFTEHFKKHKLITGIIFNENNDGKIRISAIARSEDDEKILKKIKDDILEELDTVKDSLNENGIVLNSLCLEIVRDEIIKRNIILNLLDGEKKKIDIINSIIDELNPKIENNLNELRIDGTIHKDRSEYYRLTEDISNFEKLVYRFAADKNNWNFIKSNYTQKIIENQLISHLLYKYNVIYIGKELRNRVKLLKNSPTAIYLTMNGKELLNSPYLDLSLVQGDLVLDQMILSGLSYDIFKYPIHNNEEIKTIVKSMIENMNVRFPELSNLYEEVRKNSETDQSELLKEMTADKSEEEKKYSLNIVLKNLPEEPTFLALLNAAMKTGTRIVITGGRILDFMVKEGNEPVKMEKISSIEIAPGKIWPLTLKVENSSCEFDNLEFRCRKIDELTKCSTETRHLPFKFEFDPDVENKSGNFHFEMDYYQVNVDQILKFEKFIRVLNKKGKLLFIEPEKNQILLEAIIPPIKVNNSWYEFIKKLSYIQKKTGHVIKIPEYYEIKSIDYINTDHAFELLESGVTEIEVNNVGVTLKVIEVKNIIELTEKKEVNTLNLTHPDYKMEILHENISLGKVNLFAQCVEIFEMNGIKSKIDELDDNESIDIKLIPKDEKIKLSYNSRN